MADKREAKTQTGNGPSQGCADRPSERVMTAVQARQGLVSGRVVTVLGISVALVVLGMVLTFVLT